MLKKGCILIIALICSSCASNERDRYFSSVHNGNYEDFMKLVEGNFHHQYVDDGDPILIVALNSGGGELRILKELLDRGADPNAESATNATALMEAVLWGDINKVRVLLEYGADVNKQSNSGDTAMKFLSASNDPRGPIAIAELLVEYGGNPRIKDNEGHDAIFHALNFDLDDVAKYLSEVPEQ